MLRAAPTVLTGRAFAPVRKLATRSLTEQINCPDVYPKIAAFLDEHLARAKE